MDELLFIRSLLEILLSKERYDNVPVAACAVAISLLEDNDVLLCGDECCGNGELPDCLLDMPASVKECYRRALDIGDDGVVQAVINDRDGIGDKLLPFADDSLPAVLMIGINEDEEAAMVSELSRCGINTISCDGRSVIKLLPNLQLATENARDGEGPTVILCLMDMPTDGIEPEGELERLDNDLKLMGIDIGPDPEPAVPEEEETEEEPEDETGDAVEEAEEAEEPDKEEPFAEAKEPEPDEGPDTAFVLPQPHTESRLEPIRRLLPLKLFPVSDKEKLLRTAIDFYFPEADVTVQTSARSGEAVFLPPKTGDIRLWIGKDVLTAVYTDEAAAENLYAFTDALENPADFLLSLI